MPEAELLRRIERLEQMILDERRANAERLARILSACIDTVKIGEARSEAIHEEAMKAAKLARDALAELRELRRPNIVHRN